MKTLQNTDKSMFRKELLRILEGNEMSPGCSTGVCTSGAPDGTPFPSKHSYGYALRSKGAPSNTPDAHPSGIHAISGLTG